MNCAWDAYLSILPPHLRGQIPDNLRKNLLEIRLRLGQPPALVTIDNTVRLKSPVTAQELQFCVNAASNYSPWSAGTMAQGYITCAGGHRLGLCGNAVVSQGQMTGIGTVTSLVIRVARDFPGISGDLWREPDSLLILGSPGTGKTTLLRDLIRQKSNAMNACIALVDERMEVFPYYHGASVFPIGDNTDILSGCPKEQGILSVLRNMTPAVIAVDEITHPRDCEALLRAAWSGVHLIATAHARDPEEFCRRVVYKPLVEAGLFHTLVVLRQDKTWYVERDLL